MRAASTLKITNGEQRAARKFSASWNLSLLKRCFAPSNLADTFKTGKARQHAKISVIAVQLLPAAYSQFCLV